MPRYPMPDEQVPSAHQGYRERLQRLERRSGGGSTADTILTPAGALVVPGLSVNAITTRNASANYAFYTPLIFTESLATTGIKTAVQGTNVGSVALAVYASDANLAVGALVKDYGAVSMGVAGVKTVASAHTYASGIYLARCHFQLGGSGTLRCFVGYPGTSSPAVDWTSNGHLNGLELPLAYSATAEDPGTAWTTLLFGGGFGFFCPFGFTY